LHFRQSSGYFWSADTFGWVCDESRLPAMTYITQV
jgi:hypothetical protein